MVDTVFKRRKPDEMNAYDPSDYLPAEPDESDHPDDVLARVKVAFATMSAAAGEDLPAETGTSMPADSGLGVPPFRPAPPKEASAAMTRIPFSSPAPTIPPVPSSASHSSRDPADRRTLVVGRGISVQGTVQNAERLIVEGTVESTMIGATELVIAEGGTVKGEAEVEDAEIAGTIDGTLNARGALVIRSTGRVLGTARCRRLAVDEGGQISGRMEMLTEPASPPMVRSPVEPVA
jgi:cytoskeletal protein CcmA (bactofilin family)